jgi:outer membrane receptor for ferrienterochelin and colicin
MVNLGYNFKDKKGLYLSADAYYKVMRNITNFAEKGNIFYNGDSWEEDIISGKGRSYGLELLTRKQVQKWQLQLSYALTYSDRQFPGINDGKRYPFRYDRRHNLNATISYSPIKNLDLNAVWYFSSGDAKMLPDSTGTEYQPGRLKAYHRLNLNAGFTFQTSKQLSHKISAGLYNAYQARNNYSPDPAVPGNGAYNTSLPGTRLFDLTFYLSYSFKF